MANAAGAIEDFSRRWIMPCIRLPERRARRLFNFARNCRKGNLIPGWPAMLAETLLNENPKSQNLSSAKAILETHQPLSNFAQTLNSQLDILATSIGVGVARRSDKTMGFGH
ncbi:MAG: hypothetical protein ABSD43_10205 [Terracidiphilus sp.]